MPHATLKLKIVTPERLVLEEDVTQVTLPTTEGEITILPGHVPLISSLGSGEIVAKSNGNGNAGESTAFDEVPMAVTGGFVEVKLSKDGSEVIVLADYAEHVSEIDIERAQNRAKELMDKKDSSDIDFGHFEAELERSLNRAKIAGKWRSKKYRKLPLGK